MAPPVAECEFVVRWMSCPSVMTTQAGLTRVTRSGKTEERAGSLFATCSVLLDVYLQTGCVNGTMEMVLGRTPSEGHGTVWCWDQRYARNAPNLHDTLPARPF
jgi:hypothetical protein